MDRRSDAKAALRLQTDPNALVLRRDNPGHLAICRPNSRLLSDSCSLHTITTTRVRGTSEKYGVAVFQLPDLL